MSSRQANQHNSFSRTPGKNIVSFTLPIHGSSEVIKLKKLSSNTVEWINTGLERNIASVLS